MTRQSPTLSSVLEKPAFAWLDKLAGPLQQGAHKAFRSAPSGMRVKSLLNGTPMRHRLHPALIAVPLGAWTTAAFLDLLDQRSSGKNRQRYRAGADASIALGVVGALPTALSGIADWVDTYDHPRRVGMAHAALNTAALSCYAISLGIRLGSKNHRGAARTLSGLGFGTVVLAGAIGGELVYTLGVNVPYILYPKPPNQFVDVLGSDQLVEGVPVVVEVERVPVLLLRRGDQIDAVEAWCPHAGGPLANGTFEDGVVECPWHQSRFCLADGKPLQGPASVPLRTFDAREQNGRISVRPSFEGQSWPPPPAPPREQPERVTGSGE